jgi:hypothetical protein
LLLSGPGGPGDPPAPVIGAGQVHRAAAAILGRPEFQVAPKSLLQRAEDKVFGFIGRVVGWVVGAGGPAWVGWVFLLGVMAVVVFVAWRIVLRLQRDPSRSVDGVAVDGPRRAAVDWRLEAMACEERGDWRGALRAHWRATVADLAERGLVEEVPGRTTGEYRRRVAASLPGSAEDFSAATRMFEDAWYAGVDVGQDGCARIKDLLSRVLRQART